MARTFWILSRDVHTSSEVERELDLLAGLQAAGEAVTVLLVQNAVLAARRGSRGGAALGRLADCGVEVQADDFSLRERGVPEDALVEVVRPVSIDAVVDALERGDRVVFS